MANVPYKVGVKNDLRWIHIPHLKIQRQV